MQQVPPRSPFVANRRGSAPTATDATPERGGGGGSIRDGVPLFRRSVHFNNTHHSRLLVDRTTGPTGAPGSLEAMRQFAAEASAIASVGTAAAARPRTTGSVHQSANGGGGGGRGRGAGVGRRQSTGSARGWIATTQHQHQRQAPGHLWASSAHVGAVSNASPDSRPISQQQQQQQHRPRLTRNLTLGDLNSINLPRGSGRDIDSEIGGGGTGGAGDVGGSSGLIIRRGLGAGGGNVAPEDGVTMAPRGLSNSDGRPSIGNAGGGHLGGMLSRLPVLESYGQQHDQQYPGRSPSCSIENAELFEHGMSFGVSAVKGRRPYMEDEYKVTKLLPVKL